MKDGVLFLNLSRGHVVDIDALAAAITKGKIAGCAVDVFPTEPKSNAEQFLSPAMLQAIDQAECEQLSPELKKKFGVFLPGNGSIN